MADVSIILGRWAVPLSQLRRGGVFLDVIRALNILYDIEEKVILPEKLDVFKAFRMVEPENLKVIILGMDPYPIPGEATGYAFANPEDSIIMSKSLAKIHELIEREFHNGLYLDFDVTLQSWADQGVLGLNTSLTVEAGKPGSHFKLWQPFTTALISELSKYFDKKIFCFWGKQAESFSYLVDSKKHHILTCYHPAYAIRQGKPWECDHFRKINETLDKPINW